jgi:hypothetical protein
MSQLRMALSLLGYFKPALGEGRTQVVKDSLGILYISTASEDWKPGRIRCEDCGKVAYPDYATAKARATQISLRTPMKQHLGRCGHWHVRRNPRRRPR